MTDHECDTTRHHFAREDDTIIAVCDRCGAVVTVSTQQPEPVDADATPRIGAQVIDPERLHAAMRDDDLSDGGRMLGLVIVGSAIVWTAVAWWIASCVCRP